MKYLFSTSLFIYGHYIIALVRDVLEEVFVFSWNVSRYKYYGIYLALLKETEGVRIELVWQLLQT